MTEPPPLPNLAAGHRLANEHPATVKRLLLIACSATKQSDREPLPALERYRGTWFKVLHRYRREHPDQAQALTIWILSAEFGFTAATTPIPDYNRIMTPARRRELAPLLQTQWATLSETLFEGMDTCYVAMGKQYRAALDTLGFLSLAQRHGVGLTFGQGGIGQQARQLKSWLSQAS